MEIRADVVPTAHELLRLYDTVQWSAYTQDPERLARAVAQSGRVVTAWQDGALIGLARVVTDAETILYLQDILIDPAFQRRGLGSRLLREALSPYQHVRQIMLLTDNEPAQRAFYTALGFTEIHEHDGADLRAFIQLRQPPAG